MVKIRKNIKKLFRKSTMGKFFPKLIGTYIPLGSLTSLTYLP